MTIPTNIRIAHEIPIAELKSRLKKAKMIFYGVNTPWFADNEESLYTEPSSGLPCDPRGGMLFQTDKVESFVTSAESNPAHYGKHGMRAFALAFHGCVVADKNGRELPTCLNDWQSYNELIDAAQPKGD